MPAYALYFVAESLKRIAVTRVDVFRLLPGSPYPRQWPGCWLVKCFAPASSPWTRRALASTMPMLHASGGGGDAKLWTYTNNFNMRDLSRDDDFLRSVPLTASTSRAHGCLAATSLSRLSGRPTHPSLSIACTTLAHLPPLTQKRFSKPSRRQVVFHSRPQRSFNDSYVNLVLAFQQVDHAEAYSSRRRRVAFVSVAPP